VRRSWSQEKEAFVKYPFSREGKYLSLILKLNLVFLVGLIVLILALPLSEWEKWIFILPAGTLAGITWALIDHRRKR
jgi:hypothetical protein